jgi:hypothetical protein
MPGGNEEKHENYSKDSWTLGCNLNLQPPKYKAGLPHLAALFGNTTHVQRTVKTFIMQQ